MLRSRAVDASIYGGGALVIVLLLVVEWLSHWPLLKLLSLAVMLVFVLGLVCALTFVEDKSLLKGFFVVLSPIPFLAVALFLGGSGMLNYALLLILAVTVVKFTVVIPWLRRVAHKPKTKV